MTQLFIAQSIVWAPNFGGATFRMEMIRDSVSDIESVKSDHRAYTGGHLWRHIE